MKISKNQKTAAIVLGGALILYLLYRWYENNAANSAANTAAAITPTTDTTDPTGTSTGTGSVGGGTTDWSGGAGGTIDSDLQALMAQDASNNSSLLAAIQGTAPTGASTGASTSTGTGTGTGAVAGMVSGPLNALPIAAQIALVHSGLASPSQLGPKAQQVYSHGDTTLAQYATGQKKAAPRGPTKKTATQAQATGAQVRAVGSQIAGYVNHAYKPHKSGSAVAPSHHGPKPAVKPAGTPALDHTTGGTQPHVTPSKAAPHNKTTPKRR